VGGTKADFFELDLNGLPLREALEGAFENKMLTSNALGVWGAICFGAVFTA